VLLFFPLKSHRHSALREPALACAVYDDWQILGAKIHILFVNRHFIIKKMYKNNDLEVKKHGS
jgi:hypothetical protein